MNREKIERLIAFIENEAVDDHIDMGVWCRTADCGTVCCLAGSAILLAAGGHFADGDGIARIGRWLAGMESPRETGGRDIATTAGEILGVRSWLFFREGWPRPYQNLASDRGDRAGVLKILRDLRDGILTLDADLNPVEPAGGWPDYHPDTFA